MSTRWFPPILIFILLAAAAAVPLVGKRLGSQGIEMHARLPESGGWSLTNISAVAGEPLSLRLTSDDVTHGFAIGQMDIGPVDIHPGEFTEITLTFERAGRYTYYCNRWCGANHWRMRGVIEVSGPEQADSTDASTPPYSALGIDLDKPHPAAILPDDIPSSIRALVIAAAIPEQYLDSEYYRSHSPVEIWSSLKADERFNSFSDQQLWDMVAYIIRSNTSADTLAEGRELYQENCAACHGETGAGDGVMAKSLAQEEMAEMDGSISGHTIMEPADLSDPSTALGASPALLHGKILRGGMGTGMPYWGPILTDEQLWAIVAYLQSFQYEMETVE